MNIDVFMPSLGFELVGDNSWRCVSDIEADTFQMARALTKKIDVLINGEPASLSNICLFTPRGYVSVDRDENGNIIIVGDEFSLTHNNADVLFIVEPK
ncbi:MAG: hypothetical protein LBE54_02180 [Brucellaceae bacterium]|jgi:hypothetical protein|nr:hypothetical protein [Brucellaceae bacterium]